MKYKKIIFVVLLVALCIYSYEKRSFYTNKNNISITIWSGLFGTGSYYLYPYKCFKIFQPGKEYIKVNSKNEFLELRFLDNRTMVICTYKEDYIDVNFDKYIVKKIYSGPEGYLEFNNLFPCEKCKACYSWGKIWESPYILK